MSIIIILFFLAIARAEYTVDASEGCVPVYSSVPGPFSELRIDKTDYKFNGKGLCVNTCNPNDAVECSSIEYDDGTYLATAVVCNAAAHVWTGFNVDEYLEDERHAYVTAYFTKCHQYLNIEDNCIQPQFSSAGEIDAAGMSEVEIVCARHDICPHGPFTTIMNATNTLCSDYGYPKCDTEIDGDIRKLKTIFKRPEGQRRSFVYCSTIDSFLSYVIDWG
ncbi:unnamed protein product [Rodentolepis nana]|uniref:SUEL-type lectin domain-containing protein n=1 Tax=Rodentolepis nana TaxID=102285 RepID=A0A0R3TWG5_RODNA|nr:unnamed protein product [Rodentolepis nana]